MPTDHTAFLDRPVARLLAAIVLVLCGALLVYIHRDDLRSVGSSADIDQLRDGGEGEGDPALPCIQQRFAEIEAMVDEGIAGADQAALFKERALAMCRATTGEGGQPPPLPVE